MGQLGMGIVGTGMIAGVVAEAITKSKGARLVAVSSRKLDAAKQFTAKFPSTPVEGVEALLATPGVDAIYVATPTVAKEKIALAAIAAGKHVLVDKPFIDEASVVRMSQAAAAKGLVFLDATHFVHHPRTAALKKAIAEKIGSPRSLHTSFYFPISDRTNIRFDPKQEPTGVLGDMAWYSMRAIVEYLRPAGAVTTVTTFPEIDPQTGSMIRCSGLIGFASGEVSTYDVGYTASTVLQDLQLVGTTGVIEMDDFVLDWTTSWAFHDPAVPLGYFHRTDMANRNAFTLVPTPNQIGQDILLVEGLADLIASGDTARRAAFAAATAKTQSYLDAARKGVVK